MDFVALLFGSHHPSCAFAGDGSTTARESLRLAHEPPCPCAQHAVRVALRGYPIAVDPLHDSVPLRPVDLRGAMFDLLKLQEQLIGVAAGAHAELSYVVREHQIDTRANGLEHAPHRRQKDDLVGRFALVVSASSMMRLVTWSPSLRKTAMFGSRNRSRHLRPRGDVGIAGIRHTYQHMRSNTRSMDTSDAVTPYATRCECLQRQCCARVRQSLKRKCFLPAYAAGPLTT